MMRGLATGMRMEEEQEGMVRPPRPMGITDMSMERRMGSKGKGMCTMIEQEQGTGMDGDVSSTIDVITPKAAVCLSTQSSEMMGIYTLYQ